MKNGYRIYDTHTHLGVARHSGRVRRVDDALRAMDSYGVDRAVLIPWPVVEDYKAAHDEIGVALRQYPDRFTGAACLYPFLPETEFRSEIRRCVEQLGIRALKFQPQFQPLNPISARSDFLFETAVEHDLTLIVHTGSGIPFALPSLYILAARRYPSLRVVLGHAGGPTYYAEAIVAASVCPNIYVELSSLMPHHVTDVCAHVPASRLMIGSDIDESLAAEVGKILELTIPEAERRQILWDTPRRVFDGAAAS
jgi:predicted TIM-barrel fold metal-dependent hydrolase